jgi:8-oxo-dGTP pyrophosphatase MutT (NUDIX family)
MKMRTRFRQPRTTSGTGTLRANEVGHDRRHRAVETNDVKRARVVRIGNREAVGGHTDHNQLGTAGVRPYCLTVVRQKTPERQMPARIRQPRLWHLLAVGCGSTAGTPSPRETLRREVLEETGWTIDRPRPFGCLHFHHLSPKPPDYAYIYPDSLEPVFPANALKHVPDHQVQDAYVVESRFRTLAGVAQLTCRLANGCYWSRLRTLMPPGADATAPPAEPQRPSARP